MFRFHSFEYRSCIKVTKCKDRPRIAPARNRRYLRGSCPEATPATACYPDRVALETAAQCNGVVCHTRGTRCGHRPDEVTLPRIASTSLGYLPSNAFPVVLQFRSICVLFLQVCYHFDAPGVSRSCCFNAARGSL